MIVNSGILRISKWKNYSLMMWIRKWGFHIRCKMNHSMILNYNNFLSVFKPRNYSLIIYRDNFPLRGLDIINKLIIRKCNLVSWPLNLIYFDSKNKILILWMCLRLLWKLWRSIKKNLIFRKTSVIRIKITIKKNNGSAHWKLRY